MAVGPSAPPIIPVAAACLRVKETIPRLFNSKAPRTVAKIPNCAAAPRINVFGFASMGPKSVIAPTPIKITNGATPEAIATLIKGA